MQSQYIIYVSNMTDYLKPFILLIPYRCIPNPYGPNFDPTWIIYL